MYRLIALLLVSLAALRAQSSQTLESFLSRANQLEKVEDYAGAEKIYREGLAAFPGQPEILKRLGILYQTELKFPESIEVFQKVLDANPLYPEVSFYLGMSYFGINEFQKALSGFDDELRANPKYRRARYYGAMALQALDRKLDALKYLDELVRADPSDIKVWYELARLHRSLALEALKKVADVDPDSVFIHALKAEAYAGDEKDADALSEYKEVLKRAPDFPGVHFGLGEVYYRTSQPKAEEEFRRALEEDPNHPEANYYLAEILLRSQKPAEALPLLQRAIAGDPKMAMAHFQLGKCYLALGDTVQALRAFLKASEIDPSSKEAHYRLAQVYAQLKNEPERNHHMAIFEKLSKAEKDKNQRKTEKAQQVDK